MKEFLTPAEHRAEIQKARRKALALLAEAEQGLLQILADNPAAQDAVRKHIQKTRDEIAGKPSLKAVPPK